MTPSRIDTWIHDSFGVSAVGLALYRILFAAFALLVIAPGHDVYVDLVSLAALPDSLYAPPPGPMALFDGFPSAEIGALLHFLLNVSLIALLFGVRTRAASIAVGVLFLLVYGFTYSVGKINHTILFPLLPLIMSFSGWGAAYSYDGLFRARAHVSSWPLTMLALVVGFGMFTAGFAKILGGWLDPGTHAAYGHVVKHFLVRGRTDLLAPTAVEMEHDLFWELIDYGAVCFEIGFLAAVARPRVFRFFAAFAVLFHLGVMLTLNISFVFNIIVYAAFVDLRAAGRTFGAYLPRIRPNIGVRLAMLGGVVVLAICAQIYGSPLLLLNERFVMESDLQAHEVLVVLLASIVVVVFGIRKAVSPLDGLATEIRPVLNMDRYRRSAVTLGSTFFVYVVLVATNLGEFWPFSIYPMFSQGGIPWSRAVVREIPRDDPALGWESRTVSQLPGEPYPLLEHGVDPIDLANFVSKTRIWDERRVHGLRKMFGEGEIARRDLLVMRVDGRIVDDDSVSVSFVPYALMTADSTALNSSLPRTSDSASPIR